MKIATYNINGSKARLEALTAWLHSAAPDVACLQEIKSVDEGQTAPLPIDFLGNTSDGLTVEGKGHGF